MLDRSKLNINDGYRPFQANWDEWVESGMIGHFRSGAAEYEAAKLSSALTLTSLQLIIGSKIKASTVEAQTGQPSGILDNKSFINEYKSCTKSNTT